MLEFWRRLGIGLALCLVTGGTAQAQDAASPPADVGAPAARLRVVASFSILADMVREVGGDDVQLDVLVGPMRDAHTFEPNPRDVRTLGAAQVLVVNGLGFESWMPRLLDAAGFKGQTVLASRGVTPRHLSGEEAAQAETKDHDAGTVAQGRGHDHADKAGAVDPHAWQDMANGVQYVENIAQGLAQADPAHGSAYFARADAYIRQLREADARWREQLSVVPEGRRILATSHDAFGYFGAAYGIRILSLVGISSEAEPSARAMANLLNQVRAQHVGAVFLEHGSGSQALRQLADEAGVTLGGALYADTLDKPGHEASTYLGMFRWNTGQLMAAWQKGQSTQ